MESVAWPGSRNSECFVLTEGICTVQVPRNGVFDPMASDLDGVGGQGERYLLLETLHPGACFGLGALLQDDSRNEARSAIVVQSAECHFRILSRQALFMLTAVVQERVQRQLNQELPRDPLRRDGLAERLEDARWRRERKAMIKEVARCSSGRLRLVSPAECQAGIQVKHRRPWSASRIRL